MACFCDNMISWQRLEHIHLLNWMLNVFVNFWKKKYWNFTITSSENVNHNLSKWFPGIIIMSMVFWIQSRWQIIEINKTIDLGHGNLETGTTSKVTGLRSTSKVTGLRSTVGNVSGYRCVSDCRSRGREFDPGPVPYFRGDWSWNNFYGHSPPFRWFIQEGLLSVTSESMWTNYWLTACSSLPRKKCG